MTAAEVRERVTYSELMDWMAYADEMGPLNPSIRVEWAVARALAPFLKNVNPRDLMAWPKAPERAATPDEVFGVLMDAARKNKKE